VQSSFLHVLCVQLPFIEPEYEPVPDLPDAPNEEPQPLFFPPELLSVSEHMFLSGSQATQWHGV
jgi:hypothetical protein